MLPIQFGGDVEGDVQQRGHRRRNCGGRRRWTQNARGAAGQVRSAFADDRRRGAEAGKRPALRARALFSAVTVVPPVSTRRPVDRLSASRASGASQLTGSDLYVLISISLALAFFPLGEKTSRGTREACPPASTSPLTVVLIKHVYWQEQGHLDPGTRAEWPRQIPRAGRNVDLLTPTVFSSRPSDFGRFSHPSATLDAGI